MQPLNMLPQFQHCKISFRSCVHLVETSCKFPTILFYSTLVTLTHLINLCRLSDHSRSQLLEKYRLVSRQSRDYYKLIVHNLLGKCDPQKSHNEIHRWSTEDWMWLKLNMISTLDGDASSQHLSLTQFQKTLRDYGPNHFNNPLLYFQVLLLSLQFEHVRTSPDCHYYTFANTPFIRHSVSWIALDKHSILKLHTLHLPCTTMVY